MSIAHLQVLLEQTLNHIQQQGPGALEHLASILQTIHDGANTVGSLATILATYPTLSQIIEKMIVLIQSGASIPEIAAAIAEFASTIGISTEAIASLLYLIPALL